jgi:hypothetical protein
VPTSFVLHGGEHEVRVTIADGEQQQLISLDTKNLHTGDGFRKELGPEDMRSLLPGWPQQLVNIPVFCRFLLDAFGQEAGTITLDPGAAISCVSHEETDEFVADIVSPRAAATSRPPSRSSSTARSAPAPLQRIATR